MPAAAPPSPSGAPLSDPFPSPLKSPKKKTQEEKVSEKQDAGAGVGGRGSKDKEKGSNSNSNLSKKNSTKSALAQPPRTPKSSKGGRAGANLVVDTTNTSIETSVEEDEEASQKAKAAETRAAYAACKDILFNLNLGLNVANNAISGPELAQLVAPLAPRRGRSQKDGKPIDKTQKSGKGTLIDTGAGVGSPSPKSKSKSKSPTRGAKGRNVEKNNNRSRSPAKSTKSGTGSPVKQNSKAGQEKGQTQTSPTKGSNKDRGSVKGNNNASSKQTSSSPSNTKNSTSTSEREKSNKSNNSNRSPSDSKSKEKVTNNKSGTAAISERAASPTRSMSPSRSVRVSSPSSTALDNLDPEAPQPWRDLYVGGIGSTRSALQCLQFLHIGGHSSLGPISSITNSAALVQEAPLLLEQAQAKAGNLDWFPRMHNLVCSLRVLDLSYTENLQDLLDPLCFSNCVLLERLVMDGCGLRSTLRGSAETVEMGYEYCSSDEEGTEEGVAEGGDGSGMGSDTGAKAERRQREQKVILLVEAVEIAEKLGNSCSSVADISPEAVQVATAARANSIFAGLAGSLRELSLAENNLSSTHALLGLQVFGDLVGEGQGERGMLRSINLQENPLRERSKVSNFVDKRLLPSSAFCGAALQMVDGRAVSVGLKGEGGASSGFVMGRINNDNVAFGLGKGTDLDSLDKEYNMALRGEKDTTVVA